MQRLDRVKILFKDAVEKGVLLLCAAVAAIVIANSQWGDCYESFFTTHVSINAGSHSFALSVRNWVNEFLMVIFFLSVGMEIKRELVSGYLSNAKQRILPVVAAVSGVIFPVLIYTLFNGGDEVAKHGWAIPAATDIAFAIGMLALFGKGIPVSLRIFLTALAIIDDLIAICIIAIFYTETLNMEYILAVVFMGVFLYQYGKSRFYSVKVSLAIGLFMWWCVFSSGVHATISGVILGLLMPINHPVRGNNSPLISLEHYLYPITAYIILPLFAFANSGLKMGGVSADMLLHPVTLGVAVGLFLGKQLGVMLAIFMLKIFKVLVMPSNANIKQLYGISLLCGIGFTMSLFIGIMSFEDAPQLLNQAQLGVFVGSSVSALAGAVILKLARAKV